MLSGIQNNSAWGGRKWMGRELESGYRGRLNKSGHELLIVKAV